MVFALEFDPNWLMTSMLIGTIGAGLFLYGKKQSRIPQLVAGAALIAESTFVPSIPWMLASAVLAVVALIGVVRAGL